MVLELGIWVVLGLIFGFVHWLVGKILPKWLYTASFFIITLLVMGVWVLILSVNAHVLHIAILLSFWWLLVFISAFFKKRRPTA